VETSVLPVDEFLGRTNATLRQQPEGGTLKLV
jgi:hypothetical protein